MPCDVCHIRSINRAKIHVYLRSDYLLPLSFFLFFFQNIEPLPLLLPTLPGCNQHATNMQPTKGTSSNSVMTAAFTSYLPLSSTARACNTSTTTTARRRPRAVASLVHLKLTTSSSSPSSSPPPLPTQTAPSKQPNKRTPKRSPDFFANVGTVIDTLRADYPNLLARGADLATFREDVILSAQGNQLVGKDAYRTVLFLLRAHAKLFLTTSTLHVVSMYYHDDVRPAIHLRWRMRATPRAWAASHGSQSTPAIIDGMSVYYLDGCGRVAQHSFETKVRNGPALALRPVLRRIVGVGHVAVETGMHLPIMDLEPCMASDVQLWASLPLSVQLGLLHYVYRIMGLTDSRPEQQCEQVNNLVVAHFLGPSGALKLS